MILTGAVILSSALMIGWAVWTLWDIISHYTGSESDDWTPRIDDPDDVISLPDFRYRMEWIDREGSYQEDIDEPA